MSSKNFSVSLIDADTLNSLGCNLKVDIIDPDYVLANGISGDCNSSNYEWLFNVGYRVHIENPYLPFSVHEDKTVTSDTSPLGSGGVRVKVVINKKV